MRPVARLRPDRDFPVLAKRGQQPHQPIASDIRPPSVEQGRDLRLIEAPARRRRDLGQALPAAPLPQLAGELRLGQRRLRLGQAPIGEHVAAAWGYRCVGVAPPGPCASSSLACRSRRLIRSRSSWGAATKRRTTWASTAYPAHPNPGPQPICRNVGKFYTCKTPRRPAMRGIPAVFGGFAHDRPAAERRITLHLGLSLLANTLS